MFKGTSTLAKNIYKAHRSYKTPKPSPTFAHNSIAFLNPNPTRAASRVVLSGDPRHLLVAMLHQTCAQDSRGHLVQ